MRELSDDEVFGSTKELSDADVFGPAEKKPGLGSLLAQAAYTTLRANPTLSVLLPRLEEPKFKSVMEGTDPRPFNFAEASKAQRKLDDLQPSNQQFVSQAPQLDEGAIDAAARIGRKSIAAINELPAGAVRALGDAIGSDAVADFAKGSSAASKRFANKTQAQKSQIEGFTPDSIVQRLPEFAEGAAVSTATQLPVMLTGSLPLVYANMFGQSAGNKYNELRDRNIDPRLARSNAAITGAAEVIGERVGGMPGTMAALRGAIAGNPVAEVADKVFKASLRDIPGENLTTGIEYGVDALQGINPDPSLRQYLQAARDTTIQTMLQGGGMTAGITGLAAASNALRGNNPPAQQPPSPPAQPAPQDLISRVLGQPAAPVAPAAPAPTPPVMDQNAVADRIIAAINGAASAQELSDAEVFGDAPAVPTGMPASDVTLTNEGKTDTPAAKPDRQAVQAQANTLAIGDVLVNDMGDEFPVSEVLRNKQGDVTAVVFSYDNGKKFDTLDFAGIASILTPQPYTVASTGERKMSEPGSIRKAKPSAALTTQPAKPAKTQTKKVRVQNPIDGFHGTPEQFNEFSIKNEGELGDGFYFTFDREGAQKWGFRKTWLDFSNGQIIPEEQRRPVNIMQAKLHLQNPASFKDVQAAKKEIGKDWTPAQVTELLKSRGFDGVVSKEDNEIVVFDSGAIELNNKAAAPVTQPAQADAMVEAEPSQPTQAAPIENDRYGIDNTPFSAGGKPFKTKQDAAKAKKLQPMMRVVKVEGGFALADKTPKQLAAEAKAAKRIRGATTGSTAPQSVHEFIAAQGGLSRSVQADLGIEGNVKIGNRWLYAGPGKGMTIEQATEKLMEAGYINDDSHNTAYDIIRRSINDPQYTPEGWEQVAEAEREAQFEDYLAAEQEAQPDDNWTILTPEELAETGYNQYNEQAQAEIRALIAQAEALGIDAESIMDDVFYATRNATQQDYENAAKAALETAIQRSNGSGRQDSGQAGAEEGATEQAKGLTNEGDTPATEGAGRQGPAAVDDLRPAAAVSGQASQGAAPADSAPKDDAETTPSRELSAVLAKNVRSIIAQQQKFEKTFGKGQWPGYLKRLISGNDVLRQFTKTTAVGDTAWAKPALAKATESADLIRIAEKLDKIAAKAEAETKAEPEGLTRSPDWMAELFGDQPQQAAPQQTPKPAKPTRNKARLQAVLATAKREAEASLADWQGRNYKANKKRVNFEGDGPARYESMSITAINEGRKRKNIEALTMEVKAIERMERMLDDEKSAERLLGILEKTMEQAEADIANGTAIVGKTPAKEFEYAILQRLDIKSTQGSITSNKVSRALLSYLQGGQQQETEGLTAPTPDDIRERVTRQEQAEKERQQQDREAEQRAQADAERDNFTLTGSNRPADVAAARGQQDIFGSGNLLDIGRKGKRQAVKQTETPEFKRWSNDAPLVTSAEAETYQFKTGEKVAVEAFHGTKRPDRVGTKFLKKRATSGPMAYHTSAPELASSYATGKADTSLSEEDQNYANWFKVSVPGQRNPVDIVRAWYSLPADVKATVESRMPDIRTDDDGNVIYEEGGGGIGNYEWELKQTQRGYDRRGNPLKAAVENWLTSGSLFNEEEQFMDVLRLAGMPMKDVIYDSPTAEYPFVYKNYIAFNKPLVTSDIPQEVVDALNAAAKTDRSRAKSAGADMWDKNTRTLKSWVEAFNEPDNKYVWTSIPDKVTEVFKSLGYDGIIDWSGKGGGTSFPVYIPFEETQVKSALGNKGKFDGSKNDILKDLPRRQQGNPLDRLPETAKANVIKRLDALATRLGDGAITDEQFAQGAQAVIEQVAQRKVNRGPDWVQERLIRAKRKGELEADTVDLALWALSKNPAMATDLAIMVSDTKEPAAGDYNPVSETMRIFKSTASETTAVHEILHHTERMMPPEVQAGILREYNRAWGNAYNKGDAKVKGLLRDMLMAAAGDKKAMDRVVQGFEDGTLDYDTHYALFNPSEFWAVKASDIMAKRYAVQGSWVAQAKQWLRELIQLMKGKLGLSSDAPIIKALEAVLKGDGTKFSKDVLANNESLGDMQQPDSLRDIPKTQKQSPNRDALGRVKFRLGEVALGKLDAATRPLQERFGMRMASPELRRQLRSMKATIDQANRSAANVAQQMKDMPEADRAMVSDIVEKMIAPGVVPPEHAVRVADAITKTMDRQTDELVALGMLSQDSADRWRGRYLPRIYNRKTELGENTTMDMVKNLFKTGRPTMQGIGGGSLKGRGLFQDVSVDSVDQWLAMGYEVRDPHWKLNQGKLELVDKNAPQAAKDQVTVWRDWTPSERAQMGENRDALFRYVQGYTSMQRDIALGRLFNQIANNPDWVRRSASEGWVKVPDTEIPDTGGVKRYGNLAGLYVKPDVMSHLSRFEESANEALQLWRDALGLWKEGKTALNPVAHFNNIASNISMAHFAGVSYWDGHKYVNAARDLVNDAPMVEEAREAGLFTGSFTKEELMQNMPPELQKMMQMEDSKLQKLGSKAMNALTFWLRKPLRDAYEFEDTYFKYLIYRDARKQGMSPEAATDYALKYIFTYDDLPSGARKVRDFAIPFFSWSYKAMPALLHTAMVYPWRFIAPAAMLHGINTIAYALAAGDEGDDWLKKLAKGRELEKEEREALPERSRGTGMLLNPKTIRLGTDSLTGNPVFLDASRVVPGGDMFDMENQAGGLPIPAPLMPNHPVLSAFSAMIANKELFMGREVVDKNDTGLEAAEKRAKWMAGFMLPAVAPGGYHSQRILDATANAMDTVIKTPLGEFTGVDKSGLPVQPKYAAMQTLGIKARPVDLELEASRRKAQESALVNSIAAEVRSMSKLYQKGAVSDDMMERTRETAREKIERIRDKE